MIPTPVAVLHDPTFLESLTDLEIFALENEPDFWLRPDQVVPKTTFRYRGWICGRGNGKSHAISHEINRRVRCGEARCIALVGPTEPRAHEVMVKFLIDTSPPWFKAVEYDGGVLWPNGARAYVYTAEAPEIRGPNFDLAWLTELVAWPATTRKEAFNNVTTATRSGAAQVFWDTTSKGKNDVILHLLELNKLDPEMYPITRGSMFDNYFLTKEYLRSELMKYPPGRRREEEIEGKVYAESEGALWEQAWIDLHRRLVAPQNFEIEIVGIDPALSTDPSADLTGICRGGVKDGHVFLTHDQSDKYTPIQWGDLAVDHCVNGCAGIIIERNRGGDLLIANLRERAEKKGMVIRELDDDSKPFPRRTPGVIYVRQVKTQDAKETRAYAPAAHTESGFVHHVGTFEELELEMTTWEPGMSRSPNRLDAAVYVVLELSGLGRAAKPTTKESIQQTAAAHALLREAVIRRARSQRVGL